MMKCSNLLAFGACAAAFAVEAIAIHAADATSSSPPPERLIAAWKDWPAAEAKVAGAAASPDGKGSLILTTLAGANQPALTVQPAQGTWDLDRYAEIAVPVRNLGTEPVEVGLAVFADGPAVRPASVGSRSASRALLPATGEPVWLIVPLGSKRPSPLADRFVSLVGTPEEFVRRGTIDGARVARLSLQVTSPLQPHTIAVGAIAARAVPEPLRDMPAGRVFPLVDAFGQYVHRDWPGKIHAEPQFKEQRQQEESDLSAHARPADWNHYGGWAAGPQRQKTGFFRAEKIDVQWWLIDPEGRLFWSHGVVRVGTRIRVGGIYRGTPLPDREHYFRLPPRDSPLGAFFGQEPPSTRGYYFGRGDHPVYDFLEANLFRKFGAGWEDEYARLTQRRLASWGLNTIANSSDPKVYLQHQTPYTAIVYSAPMGRSEFRIEASGGNWGKLPDPFDPGWREQMDRTLRTELKDSLNDPWCLGFFADNELHWGDSCHLAKVTLESPKEQPAKRAFAEVLKKKYAGIGALNAAWATRHESWDAFLQSADVPDRKRPAVLADLEMLSERFLKAYFGGCRDAIKAASPNHMYLGCRFAGGMNPLVMRVAARFCDVVSINRYATGIADLTLGSGTDRPILIGEFHFGALDRGPFCAALMPVADQAARAIAYRTYLQSALRNPAVVGTHWFQFYDQPTTGRFDGENFQTGLVDICDTPYAETIAAVRAVGATLYPTRLKAKPLP